MRPFARGLHGQAHVLQHREAREQVGELERAAQPGAGALGRREARQVAPIERDLPGARLELAGDQVEVGGLAGAVGADDGGERARLEGAGHGIHRHVAAEADREVLGGERGRRLSRSQARHVERLLPDRHVHLRTA